jgi:predicted metal-dependent hydrolase
MIKNTDNQTDQYIQEIKIIRSPKRKRTVSAQLNQGVLSVKAPAGISDGDLEKVISRLKKRIINSKLKRDLNVKEDLREVAERLNRKYFGGRLKIESLEYSTNQNSRFGCYNVKTGKILISHRLAKMPDWVRDYVIVHELAHLIIPNHSRAFQDLVAKYNLKERATGYLMAMGYQEEEPDTEG